MRRRFLIVLVFASVVGLLASWLVYQTIARVAAGPGEQYEKVVVAAVNMELAETVTSRHVKLVRWPKNSVPAGALRSLEEAEGRVVRSSIVAGEPLLEDKLAPQMAGRGGIMPMLVPEGRRGVTIKVDDAVKESGFILPNSRVDVLVSMAKDGRSGERIAKVVLQDVLVLAAGKAVEMRDNKPVSVTNVTLALTPEEAERLALARVEGKLLLATRNLRDNEIVRTRGATKATLLGAEPAPARPKPAPVKVARARPEPAAPVATAPPPTPVQPYTVSVLRGDKVSTQRFILADGQRWVEQK